VGEPYLDIKQGYVYTSMSKYMRLGGDHDNNEYGVFAIDLNITWEIFNETIADDDNIIDHSFFVSKNGKVMLHSQIEDRYLIDVYNISQIEFNLDTILRNEYENGTNKTIGKITDEQDVCKNESINHDEFL